MNTKIDKISFFPAMTVLVSYGIGVKRLQYINSAKLKVISLLLSPIEI